MDTIKFAKGRLEEILEPRSLGVGNFNFSVEAVESFFIFFVVFGFDIFFRVFSIAKNLGEDRIFGLFSLLILGLVKGYLLHYMRFYLSGREEIRAIFVTTSSYRILSQVIVKIIS